MPILSCNRMFLVLSSFFAGFVGIICEASSEIITNSCSVTTISLFPIECEIRYSYIENGVASCNKRSENSLVFTSSSAILNISFICNSNKAIYADVYYEEGFTFKPYSDLRWKSNLFPYSHQLEVFPTLFTSKKVKATRYEFYGAENPDDKIYVLWYSSKSNSRVLESVHWMGEKISKTKNPILIPGIGMLHIPCITPHTNITLLAFYNPIPVDNETLFYDPMFGFQLDTSHHSLNPGQYVCESTLDNKSSRYTFDITRTRNYSGLIEIYQEDRSLLSTPFFQPTTGVITYYKKSQFTLLCKYSEANVTIEGSYLENGEVKYLPLNVSHFQLSSPEIGYGATCLTPLLPKAGLKYSFNCKEISTDQAVYTWDINAIDNITSNDILTLEYDEDFKVLKCVSKFHINGNALNDIRQLRCENAFSCRLLAKCLHTSVSEILYCKEGITLGTPCQDLCFNGNSTENDELHEREEAVSGCSQIKPFNKGLVQCSGAVDAIHEIYFHGFDGKFYLGDIDPPKKSILKVDILRHSAGTTLPLPGKYQFQCEAHSFFFEEELQWSFMRSNGTIGYFTFGNITFINPQNPRDEDQSNAISTVELNLEDSSISGIICSAPVASINSKTAKKTVKSVMINISVLHAIKPKISTEDERINHFEVGEMDQNIKCQAEGFPSPTIKWFGKNGEIVGDRIIDSIFFKILNFPDYNESHAGEYLCVTSNMAGNTTALFTVQTEKTETAENKNSFTWAWALFLPVIVLLGILALLIMIVVKYRRVAEEAKNQEFIEVLSVLYGDKTYVPPKYSNGGSNYMPNPLQTIDPLKLSYDKQYELPKTSFVIDTNKLLGKGEFAEVFKGRISGFENDVAFKTINGNKSAMYLKSLVSELNILIYIGHHENIIQFYGAYTQDITKGILHVAIEYCGLGSLESYLRSNKGRFLTCPILQSYSGVQDTTNKISGYVKAAIQPQSNHNIRNLLKWCKEIANAMDFLGRKNVVHSDLATRNILLTVDFTAKLTDFGLSRKTYAGDKYWKKGDDPMPWRWMALESLQDRVFTVHTDVWSFGVTMWEIFSLGDTPYEGILPTPDFVALLANGLCNPKPKYSSVQIYNVIKRCCCVIPEERPCFFDLKLLFHDALEDDQYTVEFTALGKNYENKSDHG